MHLERIDVEMREEEGRTAFDKMIVREGEAAPIFGWCQGRLIRHSSIFFLMEELVVSCVCLPPLLNVQVSYPSSSPKQVRPHTCPRRY